ncbi:hypothetical protein [Hymenobacter arizonensis]|uniref:Uncharacterized protein n=1 Tax=Hymenobacter arizonensis TaxID=1227077 RepID=A0A1I6AX83_HYMAR|nr:hypothetical protein [Hymenobacter arizonensis]SFQ73318.1 hypothetical protein SAMN04515668_3998 [Hymenobacter arizonensis]
MKNTFSPFAKLIAIAACALSLGSCNRAEYAMLPKSGSYHGVSRAATPVPAPVQRSVAQEAPAPIQAVAQETKVAAPRESAKSVAVAAPGVASKEVAAAPAAPVTASADEAATAATVATLPQASRKLTRVQKFAASRVGRIASEVSGISQFKRTMETAKAEKIGGNLRTGIILLLVGLLITLIPGRLFSLVGGIIAVIGLIFIVLWLLDAL